jgi:hypothetical protein
MYEHRRTPPIPMRRFVRRMLMHVSLVLLLLGVSLAAGMSGYAYFEGMAWRDAFLNTSMLLGGEGPVKTEGLSDGGKVFAGFYALYSGVMFIVVMGILLAPLLHRLMHKFHWEEERTSAQQ